jgi:hypothetical protein
MCLSYPALPVFRVSLVIVREVVEAPGKRILPDILRG